MHIDLEKLCVALDALAVLFSLDGNSDISVVHAWCGACHGDCRSLLCEMQKRGECGVRQRSLEKQKQQRGAGGWVGVVGWMKG